MQVRKPCTCRWAIYSAMSDRLQVCQDIGREGDIGRQGRQRETEGDRGDIGRQGRHRETEGDREKQRDRGDISEI